MMENDNNYFQNMNSNAHKAEGKKSKSNVHMFVVLNMFIVLFFSLLIYFVFYIQVQSPDDINNSYNSRQENLAKRVVRGKIISDDGYVLAESIVNPDKSEVRNYPYAELFAHVVGFSTRGRTGIENMENITLLTSNADLSEKISKEIAGEKNIGDNVITSLDLDLQMAAYDTLGVYRGAIVAMDPDTGEIKAMVSNPTFNPNKIVSTWDELSAMTDKSPLLNRATQGLYPPGSTFKIVTLLEYIKEAENPEAFSFNCNGFYTYDDVTVNCYHGVRHGSVDLRHAFAKSCNSSFASIGKELKAGSFKKTADLLLFNSKLPIKLAYKESSFTYEKVDDSEEMLHTAIGQGKTLISPFHLSLITAGIANGGVVKKPLIVKRIENYRGAVIKEFNPSDYKRVMAEDEAAFLDDYMHSVVSEGTGSKLSGLAYTVAGKTGSAEYNSHKGESHSWFTGYSDMNGKRLVVTIIVEGAGSGSDYAVPMAKRVFDAYYK